MENVSLGFFHLSPGIRDDLCASLEFSNGEYRNPELSSQLLHVVAFEADIVAVAKGDPYHADGTVYYVDITSYPDIQTRPIADNFEDFLILASALHEATLEEKGNPQDVIGALALALSSKEDYVATWKEMASTVC